MRSAVAVALLFVVSSAASAQYSDSVKRVNGVIVEGEVQKVTSKGVTLLLPGGGIYDAPMEELDPKEPIIWDSTSLPPAMQNGDRAMQAGNHDQAIGYYQKALAGSVRGVLKQDILFNLAKCQQLKGSFKEATDSYKKLLAEYKDSRFLKDVYPALIECAMFSGDLKGALDVIKEANARAAELGLSEEFKGDMKLREGRIYEAQKQYGPAAGVYQALTTNKNPKVANSANLGLGRIAVINKEWDKAKGLFDKIIKECDNSYPMILSGAYNGLGDYFWNSAGEDKAKVKEALFCFLRTVTLYLPGPTDEAVDHERATYMAAKCFKRLADTEADETAKGKYDQQYFRLRDRLRDQYPGSPYAKDLK